MKNGKPSGNMEVSLNGATPKWMVYEGKSIYKKDDSKVSLFQETSIFCTDDFDGFFVPRFPEALGIYEGNWSVDAFVDMV